MLERKLNLSANELSHKMDTILAILLSQKGDVEASSLHNGGGGEGGGGGVGGGGGGGASGPILSLKEKEQLKKEKRKIIKANSLM